MVKKLQIFKLLQLELVIAIVTGEAKGSNGGCAAFFNDGIKTVGRSECVFWPIGVRGDWRILDLVKDWVEREQPGEGADVLTSSGCFFHRCLSKFSSPEQMHLLLFVSAFDYLVCICLGYFWK